ncbi:MAG: hypothetical protein J0L47_06975 [Flavobacteriales bacterium]|jgi:hypothetical protein|nr:hypothetical protein [Flavobacteriales bacterium]MCA0391602.1 hypothetical protein [Bacteroidota bacterium]
MKLNPFLAIAAMAVLSLTACKKEKTETPVETVVIQPEVAQDAEVLSNDSATVETAVNVKDEEQNAKEQEQKAEEKLKEAEQK